jgi:hypothetical protein
MTAPVSNIPLSIDYTSRDFYALREELITLVKNRVNQNTANQWTGDNPADFGVALIEAFAYVGDIVNFYIDRIANETYLPTATQRRSILNLADLYGYVPTGYRNALLEVRFSNTREEEVVLPIGTQVVGTVVCNDVVEDIIFTTVETAVVPAAVGDAAGEVTVYASHGESITLRDDNGANSEDPNDIAGEKLGDSTGAPSQTFTLSENQVVEGSIQIYVKQGDIYSPWAAVTHLADFGPADAVYELRLDENNFVSVLFGDGISGTIPPNDSAIKAVYTVGGGTVGNIATGVIREVLRVPGVSTNEETDILSDVTATNTTVGVGGAEPEDNRSIRTNATKAITALNKATSLEDYGNLALNVRNVGKANATASVWSSVTLYVAPQRNVTDLDPFPLYDQFQEALTPEWSALQASVQEFFKNKVIIGTTLTVAPPVYTPVGVTVRYTAAPQYTDAQAKKQIEETIVNSYSYALLSFGQTVTPEEIERILNSLVSVKNAKVTALYRETDLEEGETPGRDLLVGNPNEIFVFTGANLDVDNLEPDATLGEITVVDSEDASYVLSPVFPTTGIFSYNVIGVDENSVFVSAVPNELGGTLRINNRLATPDVPVEVATLAGVVTNIPITYTSPDGYTTLTYTLNVVRS